MEIKEAIATLRRSVVGLMRLHPAGDTTVNAAFVGTAFCVAPSKFVTAHHVFNETAPRDPHDRFYAFATPGNGPVAYCYPVVAFPHEDPALDLAMIEIGPAAEGNPDIPALPFTTRIPQDGARVVTLGFPAPAIAALNVGPGLMYQGGHFFLMSHGNEGIVAAQYSHNGSPMLEFNVGWYNGESGGPVLSLEDYGVVAVMQAYRNIQTPHGVVAGPHIGRPLSVIAPTLIAAGAVDVVAQTVTNAHAPAAG